MEVYNEGSEAMLYDAQTNKAVRRATPDELELSRSASFSDGGAGIIEIEGQLVYAI